MRSICVDEVGRGALSGPIVAAGIRVWNARKFPKASVADSKLLTDQKRRALLPRIIESCEIHYGIVSNRLIDRIGIQAANVLAIERALAGFSNASEYTIRCDYVGAFHRYAKQNHRIQFYIRGEERFSEIAAASIAAKVFRDDLMIQFEKKFPGYGFARHKGYGTKAHRRAITARGFANIHRRSFAIQSVV